MRVVLPLNGLGIIIILGTNRSIKNIHENIDTNVCVHTSRYDINITKPSFKTKLGQVGKVSSSFPTQNAIRQKDCRVDGL